MAKFLRVGVHDLNVGEYTSNAWTISPHRRDDAIPQWALNAAQSRLNWLSNMRLNVQLKAKLLLVLGNVSSR